MDNADPEKTCQRGMMEGGSTSGYFAIRMKSDAFYEQRDGGTRANPPGSSPRRPHESQGRRIVQ